MMPDYGKTIFEGRAPQTRTEVCSTNFQDSEKSKINAKVLKFDLRQGQPVAYKNAVPNKDKPEIKETASQWESVHGRRGVYSKQVQTPDMSNIDIRRVVEALRIKFSEIDDEVDRHSQEKYVLYPSSRKR